MGQLTSSLVVRLVDKVTGPARGVAGALRGLTGTVDRISGIAGFGRLNMGLAGIAASVGGIYAVKSALTSAVGAASRFESAMADVRKVVDFESPAAFKRFQGDVIEMSKRLPMAATGLSQIVAAAGQAGIAQKDLLKFTEMAAKVGIAFEISADTSGESLAKLMTALNMSVDQVGALADAMNHLSNSQASNASGILDVVRRVGADGKMFGFTAIQTSAFASAMISAGAESDVAATSFRNMGKALVRGTQATKAQRGAFRALGLDATKVAKRMQKDAVGTTIDVLERINKLPAHMQAATVSALFGDEARALGPLITNLGFLKESIGLVANETQYLGSAYKEYELRSRTFANSVQLFKNRIEALGIAVGNRLTPALSNAMNALSPFVEDLTNVFATLDDRVSIFDTINASIKGLATGLGVDGVNDLRSAITSLYDLIFGSTASFEKDVDALGATFERFRQMGAAVREFGQSIMEMIGGIERFSGLEPGAVTEIIGTLAGYGFKLAAASVGISLAAGALMSLGRAVMFVTGITAAGKLAQILKVIALGTGGTAAAGAGGAAAAGAGGGGLLGLLWRHKGLIGRAGMYGAAAWGGAKLGQAAQEVGSIAAGKFWTPKDQEEADQLKAQLDEIKRKIQEIRSQSKLPEMADILIAPLQAQADQLEQRIRSFNEMKVRPQIDASSIDAAIEKARTLKSLLGGIGSDLAAAARSANSAVHGAYADIPDGQ